MGKGAHGGTTEGPATTEGDGLVRLLRTLGNRLGDAELVYDGHRWDTWNDLNALAATVELPGGRLSNHDLRRTGAWSSSTRTPTTSSR